MAFRLALSPKPHKKFRIITPQGKYVDFGAKGYSDYTLHKNPKRMRLYVLRHGGKIPRYLLNEANNKKVHSGMQHVRYSNKEDWSRAGLDTAGFWSRWLLWSFPSLKTAKQFIMKKFNISIV
jgi:hypothetical protein